MPIRQLTGALALAATATFASMAQAEDISLAVPLVADTGAPGAFSAGFNLTRTHAGSFTDTVTFGGGASGLVSLGLMTLGSMPHNDIDFTAVMLNGQALTLDGSGGFDVARLLPTNLSAPMTLTVMGIAGPGLAVGSAIAASYAGVVNITPVPEPATLVLWAAGLGVVGLMSRRKLKR